MDDKNYFEKIIEFAYDPKKGNVEKIHTQSEYLKQFEGNSIDKDSIIAKAYEQAWDARKFEIDNYWKRTTYFWAFQVTSFAAYFAIISSNSYNSTNNKNPEILFCVVSLGFVTSLAWALINIGSKFWQRHWEKHIDMLEDSITGPLYKTVYFYKFNRTYSVTKLNEIINRFFVLIWILLGLKYFDDHLTFSKGQVAWIEISTILLVAYFTSAMFWGYGRGNFKSSEFEFYKRKVFDKDQKKASS